LGVTPRRWLLQCNPRLAQLITDTLGSEHWLVNLKQIAELLPKAEDPEFRRVFRDIKIENKSRVRVG
jgi:starch phosphorylase